MKSLLIIGAGSHGRVVREIAESLGYQKIAMLDDHAPDAIGTVDRLTEFLSYQEAFVAIGNNSLRMKLLEQAEEIGYEIPVLVHPKAYVSPSARIEKGTVVEAMAIINTEAVVRCGCIISVGAIIDHHAIIENGAHVNAGSIVKAGGSVEQFQKLEAGEVVLGYPSAIVKKG